MLILTRNSSWFTYTNLIWRLKKPSFLHIPTVQTCISLRVFARRSAFPCVCRTWPCARECGERAYFWHHVCMCQKAWANGSEHTIVYVWVWRAALPHTLTFVRKTMCFWINTLLFLCWFHHRSISICNISHLLCSASFWRGKGPFIHKKPKALY